MLTILRKEIQGFLDSPIAYVAIGVFLTGMGLFYLGLPGDERAGLRLCPNGPNLYNGPVCVSGTYSGNNDAQLC